MHEIALEPAFVALGPFHFAVGMNDRTWIYDNEGRVMCCGCVGVDVCGCVWICACMSAACTLLTC